MRRAALLVVVAAQAFAQDVPPPPRPDPGAPAAALAEDAAERRDRRERLARLAGPDAAVLVLSADDSPGFTGSTQGRDFTYLSPFDARGAAVLVLLEAPPTPGDAPAAAPGTASDATPRAADPVFSDRLYLRARNAASEKWTGPVAGPDETTRTSGLFAAIRPADALAADLAAVMRTRRTLFVAPGGPADGPKLLAPLVAALRARLPGTWVRLADVPGAGPEDVAESVRRALPERLSRDKTPLEVLAALPAIDVKAASLLTAELREVKSEAEVARIRAAVESTCLGMLDALRAAKPGMLEMHVAALVEVRCRLASCARQAYPSIVGSGPNSCVLHYAANTRALEDGDLVVMDIGGEYRGYASDVTRTFPANGRFTDEQAAVYDAVLAAQEAGIAAVKPGATMKEVHAAATAVLKQRGLVQYFIHGTSHSVGLDVHDPWRSDAPLRPGAVLTVEPGVYIAAKSLGVRIEDTVLVTETGCEVLSAGLPKTREAIEELMAEDATGPATPR